MNEFIKEMMNKYINRSQSSSAEDIEYMDYVIQNFIHKDNTDHLPIPVFQIQVQKTHFIF